MKPIISRYPQQGIRDEHTMSAKLVERDGTQHIHITNDSNDGITALEVVIGERLSTRHGAFNMISFKPMTVLIDGVGPKETRSFPVDTPEPHGHLSERRTGFCLLTVDGRTDSGTEIHQIYKKTKMLTTLGSDRVVTSASFPPTFGGAQTGLKSIFNRLHATAHKTYLRLTRRKLCRAARNQIAKGYDKH